MHQATSSSCITHTLKIVAVTQPKYLKQDGLTHAPKSNTLPCNSFTVKCSYSKFQHAMQSQDGKLRYKFRVQQNETTNRPTNPTTKMAISIRIAVDL